MILNVFVLKNRLTGIYGSPFCEKCEVKDYPEAIGEVLAASSLEVLERQKEFDVYTIGTFDTKSGECQVVAPDFVLSLEPLCEGLITVKTKKDDKYVRREEESAECM